MNIVFVRYLQIIIFCLLLCNGCKTDAVHPLINNRPFTNFVPTVVTNEMVMPDQTNNPVNIKQ